MKDIPPGHDALPLQLAPRDVRRFFGVGGDPDIQPLAGGDETSVRVGDVVLKQVLDAELADWVQTTVLSMEPTGFRVPTPRLGSGGSPSCDGWIATEFIEDLAPLTDAPRVIAVGIAFSAAITIAADETGPISLRNDRWAVADRVAWGEADVELSAGAADLVTTLRLVAAPPPAPPRNRARASAPPVIIHGDLAGNVFVDEAGVPVVLDISPLLRPAGFGSAIIVADHLLWRSADAALAAVVPQDLLARALVFRLVAEQLGSHPRHGADLDPFRRTMRALEWT